MRTYLIGLGGSHGLAKLKEVDTIPNWIKSSIHLFNRCMLFKDIELPYPGGLLYQPELLLEIFEIIAAERSLWLEEQRERARKESELKSQKPGRLGRFFRRR